MYYSWACAFSLTIWYGLERIFLTVDVGYEREIERREHGVLDLHGLFTKEGSLRVDFRSHYLAALQPKYPLISTRPFSLHLV